MLISAVKLTRSIVASVGLRLNRPMITSTLEIVSSKIHMEYAARRPLCLRINLFHWSQRKKMLVSELDQFLGVSYLRFQSQQEQADAHVLT